VALLQRLLLDVVADPVLAVESDCQTNEDGGAGSSNASISLCDLEAQNSSAVLVP
jgi:hypothetical protein